jgi:hypothetical protein
LRIIAHFYYGLAGDEVFGAASELHCSRDAGMPRKKKIKRFRAVTAVKEMARERIGTPPPTQVVPDRKKRKNEKHKPTLGKLLGDV